MLYRLFFGRRARRVYLAMLLAVAALSVGVRIRTYLLTREIQEVLAGLERVRVGVTTEAELVKTVPYLMRDPNSTSPNSYYRVVITNNHRHFVDFVPSFLFRFWRPRWGGELPEDKGAVMDFPARVAYLLGWRHLSFVAWVRISNGTVSKSGYLLEPDVFVSMPASYFVSAHTVHGYIRGGRQPMPVESIGEESPDFRFGHIAGQFSFLPGEDMSLGVAYTPAAPREQVAHVFRMNLRCYWGLRGCPSVRQVVPLLWQDRADLAAKTEARFESGNPCPDDVLAGRIRTLPDVTVALLEVERWRHVELNREGDRTSEIATDYRLVEALRGDPQGPWTGVLHRPEIPWRSSPNGSRANPLYYYPKLGDRYLFFEGARFESCRIVPATPSAIAAIRNATPAPRRAEDYLLEGRR